MRCLVVGGTGFLGGAIVNALRAFGHAVAILSRGKAEPDPAIGAEIITADRYEDLSVLEGCSFDWVFDTCAYTPDAVERLLTALHVGMSRYVLISSVSAYGTFEEKGLCETAVVPEATAEDYEKAAGMAGGDRTSAAAYGPSYGRLKRACELRAEEMLGARATCLRVGVLVGAGDYTDRLTWWVRRLDEAVGDRTKVPVPAPLERAVQMIDVRDVAMFAVRCADQAFAGIWNVAGRPFPLVEALRQICVACGSQAELVPVPWKSVAMAHVAPWTDLPLIAPATPQFRHFLAIGTEKAEAAGLMCRPFADTLGPLMEWDRNRRDVTLKCGMTPEQEALLLAGVI